MLTKFSGAVLALSLLGSAVASADVWNPNNANPAVVTVTNQSGSTINRLYMSWSSDRLWHRNLLGSHVLQSGYDMTLYADRGKYDVRLIDHDGDECILNGVTVEGDSTLAITREMLMRC